MMKDASIINSKDRLGRTLFHYGVMHELKELISFLIEAKAEFWI
jgi:hypothetical protein